MVANQGLDLKPSASIFSMLTGTSPLARDAEGACLTGIRAGSEGIMQAATGPDQPTRPDQRVALASATVSAVMLTMRRTVAEGVSTCTGLAAPSSTGPMAMPPPAVVFSRL
ncbi:MAG: hypothetical protein RL654_2484 [Pseudomonadota bacterium]